MGIYGTVLLAMLARVMSSVFLQTDKSLQENLKLVRDKAKTETEWGIRTYGHKTWAMADVGKVINGDIILFHGTSRYNMDQILSSGLRIGQSAMDDNEDLGDYLWFAATPYLAFFFGDVCLKVRVPLLRIWDAGDGVAISENIPTRKILGARYLSNWR